jgi:addiction module RelE/StbE family toxin
VEKFNERFELFLISSKNPLLRDHQLIGKKKTYRAFWITGDIRVVYKIDRDNIYLYDVGSHNQVY